MKTVTSSLCAFLVVSFCGCQNKYAIQPELEIVDMAISNSKSYLRYDSDPVTVDFSVLDTPSAEKAFAVFLEKYPRGYNLSSNAYWDFRGYRNEYFYWIGRDGESNFWVVVIQRKGRVFYILKGGARYSEFKTSATNQSV